MFIALILLAYILGSIPTGKIVGARLGVDIQKKGSGNIGFANAVRVLGWRAGFIVLIGDVTKGFIPTYIATQSLTYNQALIVGITAVLAHIFPIWLRLKGGKGVATGLGITLALQTMVAVLGFAVYLVVFTIARKSAIASILAGWSLLIISLFIASDFAIIAGFLAVLGTWTHRTNIRQMIGDKS